jgi:hypothetical protein
MSSLVHTPTPSLESSKAFYESLGFQEVPHNSLTLYTDGRMLIQINPARSARAGIRIFKDDWSSEIAELKQHAAVHEQDGVYILADPSNAWIYLETGEPPVSFTVQDESFSTLGNSKGLCLETADFQRSAAIYETLGFTKTMGSIEHGYVGYSRNGFDLALMAPFICPHLFFNPSITFFNGGKNLPVIQKIREAGIPMTEEITAFNKEGIVDNVIIRDPGGYGFFVYND